MTTIHRIGIRTPFVLNLVNSYCVKDLMPTFIDAGVNTDISFEAVKSAIRKVGGTVEGLRAIVLTQHTQTTSVLSRE